eukprot:scaffold104593_cov69-Phaeocystis_antarctica.AAC.4
MGRLTPSGLSRRGACEPLATMKTSASIIWPSAVFRLAHTREAACVSVRVEQRVVGWVQRARDGAADGLERRLPRDHLFGGEGRHRSPRHRWRLGGLGGSSGVGGSGGCRRREAVRARDTVRARVDVDDQRSDAAVDVLRKAFSLGDALCQAQEVGRVVTKELFGRLHSLLIGASTEELNAPPPQRGIGG